MRRQAFDLGVASRLKYIDRRRVNAFEQKKFDPVFFDRGFRHKRLPA